MTEVLHEVPADLSALAWVADELKRTLETAHKALRRQVRESDSMTHVQPAEGVMPIALQQARTLFHQGAGALTLVDEIEGAQLLQASELAVAKFGPHPRELDNAAVATIERASFALLDYLRRRLAGKAVPPVALFPQYRSLLELAGADRVHPADLWRPDESPARMSERVEALGRSAAGFGVPPLPADAQARGLVEQTMLSLLRGPVAPAAAQMGRIFAGLAAGAAAGRADRLAGTWMLASGFYEAQSQGLMQPDLYVKRLTSRLLSQVRLAERGQPDVSERLLQDLLFFCTRVRGSDARAPHLAATRRALPPTEAGLVDYERDSLGRYDPALLPLARRRVEALKETWSSATGGQAGLGTTLREQAANVADSVRKLDPQGDHLARALEAAAAQVADATTPPSPGVAMEVATSLLCLDAALDDAGVADDDFGDRIQQLARRVDLAREGRQPGPVEPWMEDLYRRASDRQTMGSVVQELRSSLAEVELQLDRFNRNPKERDLLIPVPAKLSAMRGVLSVLGLDQAGHAVVHMRDEVDAVLAQDAGAEPVSRESTDGAIARLAANLGALSFLIDLLAVQPQLAKSLFRFDAEAGRLEAVMGRTGQPGPAPGAAAAPELPSAPPAPSAPSSPLMEQVQTLARGAGDEGLSKAELMHRLEDLKHQAVASDQRDLAEAAASARSALARADDVDAASLRQDLAEALTDYAAPPAPAAPAPAPAVSPTATAEDDEMLEIFFEEAGEVVASARDALAHLESEPENLEALSTVRRAFHTLKGSSRMVGLKDFGEAAWACEQLYNTRLADAVIESDAELRAFSHQALEELARWVDALVARDASAFHSAPIVRAAQALREQGLESHGLVSHDPAAEPAGPVTGAPASAAHGADANSSVLVSFAAHHDEARAPAGEPTPFEPASAAGSSSHAPLAVDPALEATVILDPILIRQARHAHEDEIGGELPLDDDAESPAALRPLAPDFSLDLPLLSDEIAAPATHSPAQGAGDLHSSAQGAGEGHSPAQPAGDRHSPAQPAGDRHSAAQTAGDRHSAAQGAGDRHSPAQGADGAHATDNVRPLDFSLDLGALDADQQALGADQRTLGAYQAAPPVAGPDEPGIAVAWGELSPVEALPGERVAEAAANDADTERGLLPPDDDHYKVIGPLRIGLGLFNVFLNEADEQSRRLCTNLAEWALELPRPVGEEAIALAHSLGGSSATVGHAELSALARRLEHALEGSQSRRVSVDEARLYGDVSDEIRRLLHQFAAGFLQSPHAPLLARLAAFQQQLLEHPAALEPSAGAEVPEVPEVPEVVEDDFQNASFDTPSTLENESPRVPEDAPGPFVEPEAGAPAAPAAAVPESGLGAISFSTLDEPVRAGPVTGVDVTAADPGVEAPEFARDLDAVDAIDPDLFEIFVEEAHELLPGLASHLRAWEAAPATQDHAFGAMRALHTLKGSARLAGAMRLGEIAHRLETAFEDRVGGRSAMPPTMEQLHAGVDALSEEFHRLQRAPQAAAVVAPATPTAASVASSVTSSAMSSDEAASSPQQASPSLRMPGGAEAAHLPPHAGASSEAASGVSDLAAPAGAEHAASASQASRPSSTAPAGSPSAAIDWSRFSADNPQRQAHFAESRGASNPAAASVRVRAPLLDRLVNQAGEVSITRSRLEADVGQMRGALRELTDNLERLRHQLRDIEVQADSQIASRLEASRSTSAEFDPLEMDRFTRFQELTRMMAESVNDVATVQRSLTQTVQSAEDEMAVQARLTRALSEDLLRARMVPFDTLSERLYRVVRQAAKETGVQVRLNIEGGAIELDRSVLDRIAGAFEHLLRNAVVHGIESPDTRRAQDKDPIGTIEVGLAHQGNEVRIEIRDDGSGLDLQRIAARGRRNGLIAADAHPTEAELANLIFTPGFSTAESVTELAGRGVGMDVVRADVTALGGRIETASTPGRGTAFRLLLPLTTAVTRVVQLRCGDLSVAVPASLVEVVRRAPLADVERAYLSGQYRDGEHDLPFFWLGALLQASARGTLAGKTAMLVLVRSAQQRVVLHVDTVVGNQEVVVKNLGPQLARLPGLAGMSLLATGEVVPIYNPVALAAVYGHRAAALAVETGSAVVESAPEEVRAPLVLVVDDSLTVRRVTQRLLVREGYRVATAKDGLDALEQLEAERPAVILSDIEMPRMDGFDLLRNVRHDSRWQSLPVIMITSRIAQKHRDLAMELGANHYLGKPYDEEHLIALIQENVARALPA